MAKAHSTRRKAVPPHKPVRLAFPPELRPVIERIYSAVAVGVATLESQAADRDIDVARVLRYCALQPLGDLAWPLDDLEGGAP